VTDQIAHGLSSRELWRFIRIQKQSIVLVLYDTFKQRQKHLRKQRSGLSPRLLHGMADEIPIS